MILSSVLRLRLAAPLCEIVSGSEKEPDNGGVSRKSRIISPAAFHRGVSDDRERQHRRRYRAGRLRTLSAGWARRRHPLAQSVSDHDHHTTGARLYEASASRINDSKMRQAGGHKLDWRTAGGPSRR